MAIYKFFVQGSEVQPYETVFNIEGNNITASCTCAAGKNAQYCKHRVSILTGDSSNIKGSKNDLPTILAAFQNSPLAAKLSQLKNEEQQLEQVKKRVEAAKKEFTKMLIGR